MTLQKRILGLGLLLLFVVGCGKTTVDDTPVTVEPVSTPLKTMLEEVVETGQLGSGAMSIRDAVEGMRLTDDAKATELAADLDDMEKTGDPKQIKQKAEAMIKKL
jgi:hypothetical protein